MRSLDWLVLGASLVFIVAYGLWKGRRNRDLDAYLLADRVMRWPTVALAIMATQASAITFLSTPGQAYADGMRFVQFYFGLPIAMVILSMTAVPIFHRLKVYTAYEYLEGRFDAKTRTLAVLYFLLQRSMGCAFTIYAPALILSTLLGWNITRTIVVIGVLVILYTALGGNKAVNHTKIPQTVIILFGMMGAFVVLVMMLPRDVSFGDAVYVAGKMGRLNAIDFSFDLNNRYNVWSGLIGGFFLAMAYFGTDQSQVGRYLTGTSVAQSRLGLLFNGMAKIPMQFVILFIGATLFAFYQFVTPPLLFNSVAVDTVRRSGATADYQKLETEHQLLSRQKQQAVRAALQARQREDPTAEQSAIDQMRATESNITQVRKRAFEVVKSVNPKAEATDTNYVFLNFVIHNLPAGLVGLVLAAVFAASMSSSSSELNALASTTIVDIYKRWIRPAASDQNYVNFSKAITVVWGVVAILFANYATRMGSLVEAVNILGSLFYGATLGIFLVAFYMKRAHPTAVFIAGIVGELVVVYCWKFTKISFLWYNLIGCAVVALVAWVISRLLPPTASKHEPGGHAAQNAA
jgi:Na+/proline symporter